MEESMRIYVINGPSINMLGIREPNIYGSTTYKDLIEDISLWAKELGLDVECYQSNVEGEIVNFIQKAYFEKIDGIVATIMALDRAIRHKEQGSVYDDPEHGLWSL